ncbi:MAG: extracellular solute-binding protein [Firmicutes bacterium]|nr:extracellular solute-binding protein [Bacillota bacterium]
MKIRSICLLVALSFIIAISGCGKKQTTTNDLSDKDISFPLENGITLTYFVPNAAPASVSSYNDIAAYKKIQEITNITLKFIHPVANQVSEQFNIMIASGDYVDVIERPNTYSGGILKAYQDKVIIRLNEYMDKYAPNLTAIYNQHPAVDALANIDGDYYVAPLIRGGQELCTYVGTVLRRDWLKELNLEVPQTISEWETVLTAFKEKKGAKAPFSSTYANFKREMFSCAFGVGENFYVLDGKVHYGPYEDAYKDYVRTMADWYDKGLIDAEIPTISDSKILDSKVLNGEAGAYIGTVGTGIGGYLTTKQNDPVFDLVAAPYPVINKGDRAQFVQHDQAVSLNNAAISTKNKYPAETVALLDYMFSKEGYYLCNFGIEGESYVMVDNQPTFTELITKNPEGLSMSVIGMKYCRSFVSGPFVQSSAYVKQFYSMPQQREASELWVKQFNEAGDKAAYGQLTVEENQEHSKIFSEISTYKGEMFTKWLMGTASIDSFEEYREKLREFGIERVIKLKQQAYDRFIQRNSGIERFDISDVESYYNN